jgi:hypothetical protein
MKQGVLLCKKNIHYKHATMESSGTNLDTGQIKNEKFQILSDKELHIQTNHTVLLGPRGQGRNKGVRFRRCTKGQQINTASNTYIIILHELFLRSMANMYHCMNIKDFT